MSFFDDISSFSKSIGFVDFGITESCALPEEQIRLEAYLQAGYHGQMDYLARNVAMRCNPALLVEKAASIWIFLAPYAPSPQTPPKDWITTIRSKNDSTRYCPESGHTFRRQMAGRSPIRLHCWNEPGLSAVGSDSSVGTACSSTPNTEAGYSSEPWFSTCPSAPLKQRPGYRSPTFARHRPEDSVAVIVTAAWNTVRVRPW